MKTANNDCQRFFRFENREMAQSFAYWLRQFKGCAFLGEVVKPYNLLVSVIDSRVLVDVIDFPNSADLMKAIVDCAIADFRAK